MMTSPSSPAPATKRTGPLAGIRVLDLTAVVLGPLATQLLGDYGADVIKVESLEGDLIRVNGSFRDPSVEGTMSSVFLTLNRNKRSLAIDLKRPEGIAALRRLLPTVDVLIHNMRSAAMERLGLSYAASAAIAPRLIYCVATGFGEGGPDAGKPALDDIIQAACGLADLIGHESGEPGYVPSLIADKTAGLALANAVLAALFERTRSGIGQYVEVPMLETMVAFTMVEHMGGLAFDPPSGPPGYPRLIGGGRKPVPTRDGHVAVLPFADFHWRKFFNCARRSDLAEKYGTLAGRISQVRQLYDDMAELTSALTTEEVLAICRNADIPGTAIYPMDRLQDHPHLKAVDLFQQQDHPFAGSIVAIRPTTIFSRTPAEMFRPAPELGEHSLEVLREAGYSAEELRTLCDQGVTRQAPAAVPTAGPAGR